MPSRARRPSRNLRIYGQGDGFGQSECDEGILPHHTTITPPNVVVIITDDQCWGMSATQRPRTGSRSRRRPWTSSARHGLVRSGLSDSMRRRSARETPVEPAHRAKSYPACHEQHPWHRPERAPHAADLQGGGISDLQCGGKWHMGGSDKNNHLTIEKGRSTRIIPGGPEYAPFNRGFDSHYGNTPARSTTSRTTVPRRRRSTFPTGGSNVVQQD